MEDTRLEKLKRLEAVLAEGIQTCEVDKLASLARQYRETLREIEEIEGQTDNGDSISKILQKRESDGKPGAVRPSRS